MSHEQGGAKGWRRFDDAGDDAGAGDGGNLLDRAIVVALDGWPFEYYPAGAEMSGVLVTDLFGYEYRYDALVDAHPRLRRSAMRYRIGSDARRMFGALHFGGDVDLVALDAAVVAQHRGAVDAVSEDLLQRAMDDALFCEVVGVTCQACHCSTVVAVAGGAGLGSSLARKLATSQTTVCPSCGDRRFIRHVAVLSA